MERNIPITPAISRLRISTDAMTSTSVCPPRVLRRVPSGRSPVVLRVMVSLP